MKTISILIPCYNEQESLPALYKRLKELMDSIENYQFEIMFVNDGSRDDTLKIIKDLRAKDSRVNYVDLSRNFGKEIAMIAGIDHINTDAMIVMDADLQDPPELIKEMLYWWEQGYNDVCAKRKSRAGETWFKKVCAKRKSRAGETWFKKWSSHTYYKILQKVSRIPVQPDVGDFRLLDRQCIEALKELRETQRYTKGLFSWIGFDKKEILFDRDARIAGKTKWNYFGLFNLAVEGITSFTIFPLRLASIIGIAIAVLAIIYMLFIIVKTLIYGGDVAGYPSLISVILFIGGVQLVFLGIMGEYLGRIFNETKGRPLYFVKECTKTK